MLSALVGSRTAGRRALQGLPSRCRACHSPGGGFNVRLRYGDENAEQILLAVLRRGAGLTGHRCTG
jgi:hypothetical protein